MGFYLIDKGLPRCNARQKCTLPGIPRSNGTSIAFRSPSMAAAFDPHGLATLGLIGQARALEVQAGNWLSHARVSPLLHHGRRLMNWRPLSGQTLLLPRWITPPASRPRADDGGVPTMLTGPGWSPGWWKAWRSLLANRDQQLYFALLTDFPTRRADPAGRQSGRAGAGRHRCSMRNTSPTGPTFFLFHRPALEPSRGL